jgi:diguanylate cyclase (GGDEF)-like protein/PAS domain S-box-containing protein
MRQHLRSLPLTVTQRLWLGLGVIVALFAAANLVSLRATRELDQTLSGLVARADARAAAAYDMKIHLADIRRALADGFERQEPAQRARARAAQAGFESALSRYRESISGDDSRDLAQRAEKGYGTLAARARELDRLIAERARKLGELASHQRTEEALLQAMPNPPVAGRDAAPVAMRSAVSDLRAAFEPGAAPAEWLIKTPPDIARARLEAHRQRVADALSRYRRVASSTAERDWAAMAERWHVQRDELTAAVVGAAQAAQDALARAQRSSNALEALLDERLQPAAKAELTASLEGASATAHRANGLMINGLLLALLLAVLVALATSRAVRAPLHELVASTRRFAEGDFAHRVRIGRRDELSAVASAFNEMAASLQATTVSRGYMESLIRSMGEALLVVSADGSIEMANPAAHDLLGYAAGELQGKPFQDILDHDDASAGTMVAPSRFAARFRARDGSLIPVAVSAVPLQIQPGSRSSVVCVAQDLRERLAAEHDQRQAAVVFDNTREGILLTDANRAIVTVNPAFSEITGFTQEEIQGRPVRLLWAKRHDSAFAESVWRAVHGEGQWQGEVWLRRKDGELCPVWKNISAVRDPAGQIVNYVCVFSDVSEIKDAEQRLDYLVYHDPLTDLPNRSRLSEQLRSAISRGERLGSTVALLYLDLDNFKHVNDTLGHEEGDRLLRSMAARLQVCVRGKDAVARLGGDEFVVLLEDVRDANQAARVAEKILAAMSAPFELSGFELRMRASIGISLWPQHGDSAEALLKAADAAMYRAKSGGRGRYEFFSPDLTEQALQRLTLEHALRDPRLTDQLVLHYQPQFSVRTGGLVGAEALIRWQHPARGLLSPDAFVPHAEEAGLIEAIGDWVLRTACAQARLWLDAGHPPFRMAVNVSAYQIRSDRIVEVVRSALSDARLDPRLLELEVTEGALQTVVEAAEILGRLKAVGVQLALDDFGTGYSALSSLKLLPFDRLKIDRSFIRDLEQDPDDRALARAIIAMGRSLGLEIVAEGVETTSQLAFLRKHGCHEMQGYLFGRPEPAHALEATLRGQHAVHAG